MNQTKLFSSITDTVGQQVLQKANLVSLPANTTVFYQGASCENYLLVLTGRVKVFTRAENGREIILYRVNDGESCTLTTTCLLAGNQYPAEGVTETSVEALAISLKDFNLGLSQSPDFRNFVFNTYGKRLVDVITLVGEVSFGRIDVRLAKHLLDRDLSSTNILTLTHQDLAIELGTAREVVSRQLKEFEQQGWLKLSRGKITLMEIDTLINLSKTALV